MSHHQVFLMWKERSTRTLLEVMVEYAGEKVAGQVVEHPSHECMRDKWGLPISRFNWDLIDTVLGYCDARVGVTMSKLEILEAMEGVYCEGMEDFIATLLSKIPLVSVEKVRRDELKVVTSRPLTASEAWSLSPIGRGPGEIQDDQTIFEFYW